MNPDMMLLDASVSPKKKNNKKKDKKQQIAISNKIGQS
jgi:hypothetical protein